MIELTPQPVLTSLATGAVGATVAYLVATFLGKRRINAIVEQQRQAMDSVKAERSRLAERVNAMRGKIGSLEGSVANYRTELEAVLDEKSTESDRIQKQLRELTEKHQRDLGKVTAENARLTELCTQMRGKLTELETRSESDRVALASTREERDALNSENQKLVRRSGTLEKASVELTAAVEALRAERETTKSTVNKMQDMLAAVHQRTLALQTELEKAGEFYKRELTKSFKKRQQLEADVKTARAGQEAFRARIESSIEKHGSTEEMILNAEARLGQISVLERNVNRLEAEKSDLREDVKQLRLANESLQLEVAELVELRIHNGQLVKAVEGLEQSRQQHESQADEARNKAEQSKQLSDTLRTRLSDLEQGFADMEREQSEAIRHLRSTTASARPAADQDVEYHEKYDLIA